jgi:diamine N-acetyltransferase
MNIIEAKKNQLNLIQELAYKIWPDAYSEILSQEQLNYMLDKFYSLEALNSQFENEHVFLLVEDKGDYLGFASYELNYNNSSKTKLHKLYVLPQTQGTGVGKNLLQEVAKRAKSAQNSYLFLNVNKYNKAQNFYRKLQFKIISEEIIPIGNDFVMDDFVMEKELN